MREKLHKEEKVQAYVDQALDYDTAKQVKKLIQSDPIARNQFIKLIRQKQLLKLWWENSIN